MLCLEQTTPEADRVFAAKATPTILKIKKDVTRHRWVVVLNQEKGLEKGGVVVLTVLVLSVVLRYGDDAHLDTTVQALGLVIAGKEFPQLQYIKQVGGLVVIITFKHVLAWWLTSVPGVQGVEDGELVFSMIFKSDETPYRMWAEPERVNRYERFFGPGVRARVEKVDAAKRLVAITLLTGEGKKEEEKAAVASEEAQQPVNADF